MINLTWGQIRDPEFNPIMERILNSKMPFHSARRILSVMRDIREEQKLSDEMWTNICAQYLEPVPENPQYMRPKEGVEEAVVAERVSEFMGTPVEIGQQRISAEELMLFDISPVQLLKLEGLIEAID